MFFTALKILFPYRLINYLLCRHYYNHDNVLTLSEFLMSACLQHVIVNKKSNNLESDYNLYLDRNEML